MVTLKEFLNVATHGKLEKEGLHSPLCLVFLSALISPRVPWTLGAGRVSLELVKAGLAVIMKDKPVVSGAEEPQELVNGLGQKVFGWEQEVKQI